MYRFSSDLKNYVTNTQLNLKTHDWFKYRHCKRSVSLSSKKKVDQVHSFEFVHIANECIVVERERDV